MEDFSENLILPWPYLVLMKMQNIGHFCFVMIQSSSVNRHAISKCGGQVAKVDSTLAQD